MLFIVIILAFIFYIGLYLLWMSMQSRLDSSTSILRTISELLFVPDHEVFMILRSLIFLALFYVIADFFLNSAKRGLKRRRSNTQSLKATFNTDDSHVYRDSPER